MPLHLRVEKKLAQRTIERLRKEGKLSSSHKILHDGNKVWIPLREGAEVYGAVEKKGEPLLRKAHSLDGALAGILSERERKEVVSSFDIIGDIAVVEIPEGLEKKEKEIAQAVMEVHKNVRVVAKKQGPMEGVYRTRKLRVIFGENRTETIHSENGVRMLVDVEKVYFSPRLSYERKRIAGLVKDGERILALFAGVGPFPLVIAKAKKGKGCEIVAIELNPAGAEYMKKNVKLNKLAGITGVEGDVGKIVPAQYADYADRVLMPLPKDAEFFLKAACAGAKDGAVVHFYTFAGIGNPFAEAREKIAAQLGAGNFEIVGERIVRPFSPALVQVAVDFRLRKK